MKIVYTSATGFTKQYAEMLSQELQIAALPLSDAKKSLEKGEEIIYMGWLNGGKVEGLKSATSHFRIIAVCAVGMGSPTATVTHDIRSANGFSCPCFYLQGGFDMSKLTGINKVKMQMVFSSFSKQLPPPEKRNAEENKMYDLFVNGGSFVSREKLRIVVDWYDSYRLIIKK